MGQSLLDQPLAKPTFGFAWVKRNQRTVRTSGAARAAKGFGRDVPCGDNAWKEAGKIQFEHVKMQAWCWVEVKPASIGMKQIPPRRRVLRTVLSPRDEHPILHSGPHLDGADDRSR